MFILDVRVFFLIMNNLIITLLCFSLLLPQEKKKEQNAKNRRSPMHLGNTDIIVIKQRRNKIYYKLLASEFSRYVGFLAYSIIIYLTIPFLLYVSSC
jgi:hypothetical protein